MTPAEVLARVLEAGGRIIADPGRLRLLVPPAFKPLVAEHREALRELICQTGSPTTPSTPVPALRRALRAYFVLLARGTGGDPEATLKEARALLSEIRRLWDDVGPAFAEAVERQETRAYHRETGRCPYCGEIAVFHDPERGGEAA